MTKKGILASFIEGISASFIKVIEAIIGGEGPHQSHALHRNPHAGVIITLLPNRKKQTNKNLQRLRVELSESLAFLALWGSIKGPLKPRTSQHNGIEEFKWIPQLNSHYTRRSFHLQATYFFFSQGLLSLACITIYRTKIFIERKKKRTNIRCGNFFHKVSSYENGNTPKDIN